MGSYYVVPNGHTLVGFAIGAHGSVIQWLPSISEQYQNFKKCIHGPSRLTYVPKLGVANKDMRFF